MTVSQWRWATLICAPHRVGFFAGALLLTLSASWWLVVLLVPRVGVALPWAVAPAPAHGFVMALSAMPMFIAGFLVTAGPRWLGLAPVPGRALVRPTLVYGTAWILALAGFHASALLAAFGVGLSALAWSAIVLRIGRWLLASVVADRTHMWGLTTAASVGVVSLATAALALAADHPPGLRAATALGLWGFLGPTFVLATHRMLPFFDARDSWAPNAAWPDAVPFMLCAVLALTAGALMWEALGGALSATAHMSMLLVQSAAAVWVLWLVWRWRGVQAHGTRLVSMLHGSFVWLGLALVLSAAANAQVVLGLDGPRIWLAGGHALALGFFCSTLLAMITRVVAGHTGRAVAVDRLALALYGAMQFAAAARVLAALWPASAPAMTILASVSFVAASVGWCWRYSRWMGRPRVDGRPG